MPPVGNATGHMRAMGRGMWAAPVARQAASALGGMLRGGAAPARARAPGAACGGRGIKTHGLGATYVQYPFEVEPEKATRRGQKTSHIFAQHNAGSKFVMINRPQALNALNLDMIRELDGLYRRVQGNPLVGLVLLYGGGDKAFCAGGDVRKLAEGGVRARGDKAPQMDFFREVWLRSPVRARGLACAPARPPAHTCAVCACRCARAPCTALRCASPRCLHVHTRTQVHEDVDASGYSSCSSTPTPVACPLPLALTPFI